MPILLVIAESTLSRSTTESQFVGDGREHIVSTFQFVYWPDKARVGVRSPGCSIYWKENLSTKGNFVLDQNEETS